MAQGLVMFGADARVALVNQRYIDLYGMSSDIVREGCSYLDIMRHKKQIGLLHGDPETYCDDNRARIAEGESWTEILDLPEDRFIRIFVRPLGDGGWVSTHEDITESRHALTQLGEQKMQLDVAVENMIQGLVLFDPDERIALVNNRYIQMYKLSRNIVKVGCSIVELIKHRRDHGSIPGDADEFYRVLRDRRVEGKSWNRIVELSDGRHIQVSHQPLANGGWVSTHEDITERTEAERAIQEREERIRAIMDNAADGIITITDHGIIESFNQASEMIFGYSEDEVRGKNVKMMMPEPDHGQHDNYIANYLKTGKGEIIGVGPKEVSARHKDGTIFPMSLAISVMDVGGEQKFIGITRDITRQKETELQLQQAQKMETIGQLTAGIAHDFNNLLTVIMGNLQLVTRSINDNDMALKRLDSTMSAAKSGAALISQLLSFSRQQVLETKIFDLNELVRDMEDMLRRTMGDDIVITTELDSEPCLGRTDRYQLEHVLLNLCVNARDAMPGGGNLAIKTGRRRLDEAYVAALADVLPGNYIEVIVSDTGAGIPPDIRDKIFEPFFSTKERGKGSGLGLSTVLGFMKQTDGHVEVESEVGHGATFRLFIPIAGFASSAVIDRRSATSDPLADSHGGSILVVADEG
jgi:PAS domain S-box-containing protein